MARKIKVGIVTWLGGGNYGTTLQSFALHEKLRQMGYAVYYIGSYNHAGFLKGVIRSILSWSGFQRMRYWMNLKKSMGVKGEKLFRFVERNYNIKKPTCDYTFNKLIKNTDVFVTGSDQIWNVAFRFNPFMFLDFATGKRKVAYASSIGLSDIPNEYKDQVRTYLSDFSCIGVREKTAVDILSRLLLRGDILQVLDPTFLLPPDNWIELCNKAEYEEEIPDGYILFYLIGNNDWYVEQANEVIRKIGIYNVVIVPSAENPNLRIDGAIVYNNAGPIEFVDLIRRASFVCTDSFHATALSINLSKNFVTFLRFKDTDGLSQNSRIYDLLNHYGLLTRLYEGNSTSWWKPIDYNIVQKQLDKDREQSLSYFTHAIDG